MRIRQTFDLLIPHNEVLSLAFDELPLYTEEEQEQLNQLIIDLIDNSDDEKDIMISGGEAMFYDLLAPIAYIDIKEESKLLWNLKEMFLEIDFYNLEIKK